MSTPEQTFTYSLAFDPAFDMDPVDVTAAYFRHSETGDFVEFKDSGHAVVFSAQARHVVCIRRHDA